MDKIFIWKNYGDWSDEFKKLSFGLLSEEFIAKIKPNAEEIYNDDCGPLEELIMVDDDNIINYEKFIEGFKNSYTHILTFHASRPVDVKSYYMNGLQKISFESLQNRFREIYLNGTFPEISETDIVDAIQSLSEDYSRNELYVTLDDREFISDCGHYLIYGSEYLSCLALRLKPESKYDYRSHLRTIGIPTIYKIKIPISMVHDDDLRCLYNVGVRHWIYNYLHKRSQSSSIDFTFLITDNIPAENVIDHWHPTKIRDWLNNGMLFHVKENKYTFVRE
jgi:hypothetical protein